MKYTLKIASNLIVSLMHLFRLRNLPIENLANILVKEKAMTFLDAPSCKLLIDLMAPCLPKIQDQAFLKLYRKAEAKYLAPKTEWLDPFPIEFLPDDVRDEDDEYEIFDINFESQDPSEKEEVSEDSDLDEFVPMLID